MNTQFDVLIIGAGLSGIGTACQIQKEFPNKRLAILERRQNLGGTWDLFRYPGIRSDSDMFSFGYKFRPWSSTKVLADGPAIRQYIGDTAAEYGIDKKIHYGLKILRADWSSAQQHWTLSALDEASGEMRSYTCNYLVSCTGYYNHDAGFLPKFPGVEQFKGQCIHPQHWPENLDYSGKKVVVIGSGATAVTLVPAMAGKAAQVTMLQRSPSYIFSIPDFDKISAVLSRFMPDSWVYKLARERNILIQRWLYLACRRFPKLMRRVLLAQTRKHLGPDFDMSHFTPKYMPWDERLCAVPDANLFETLKSGQASIVTDQIERFTENGILLKSGKTLEADIIITATGLNLQMLGGVELRIDGQVKSFNQQMTYKALLVQDVPNYAWMFGYTNAPWTLKSDMAGQYLCRLFRHMDARGLKVVTPRDVEGCSTGESILDSLQSGYVQRAKEVMPRQGHKLPWKVLMHFGRDKELLLRNPVADGVLQFEGNAVARAATPAPIETALAA
ncbi:MAG TPA: NAD(P)/FAD-dependent oxidoreductase [Solimonas sp.]|nr:NAD(P)/FAD-dependent oxidoreductase [Solimonas sp.]